MIIVLDLILSRIIIGIIYAGLTVNAFLYVSQAK